MLASARNRAMPVSLRPEMWPRALLERAPSLVRSVLQVIPEGSPSRRTSRLQSEGSEFQTPGRCLDVFGCCLRNADREFTGALLFCVGVQ